MKHKPQIVECDITGRCVCGRIWPCTEAYKDGYIQPAHLYALANDQVAQIPASIRAALRLAADEILRQRGYIDQLHAMLDA